MRKLSTTALLVFYFVAAISQDIVTSYNISRISSYIKVGNITPDTYSELKDSIMSMAREYHSADFVIDFLDTEGDYGMNAVILADSISKLPNRLGILIGQNTKGAAEQTAMFLRNAKKAVLVGTVTKGGLAPDVLLEANNDHLTAWYDSIQQYNILPETIKRYVYTHEVKSKYKNADAVLENFHDDGVLIDTMNKVAEEHGIKVNTAAFYYSGFVVMSLMHAELLKTVFPLDTRGYHKALNVPVQQVIYDTAVETLETAQYRDILFGES